MTLPKRLQAVTAKLRVPALAKRGAVPALLLAALLLFSPGRVLAHDLLLSTVDIAANGSFSTLIVRTPLSHLARMENAPGQALTAIEIDLALRHRLAFAINGQSAQPGPATLTVDTSADMLTWQSSLPASPAAITLGGKLFPEQPASETRVRATLPSGQTTEQWLGDPAAHGATSPQSIPSHAATFWRFLTMGLEHIASGPDHVAFVVGLLLLGGSLRSLLVTVTAFTLAHSVTLGLAATGIVSPSPRIIEPLIALSIVAIAAENLIRRGSLRRRPYYAFAFGLVHGFGIAGPLRELGIATTFRGLLFALVPFNLGVEIAQAAIILLCWPLLLWLARERPIARDRLAFAGSLAIGILGSFWFITRLSATAFQPTVNATPSPTSPDTLATTVNATFKPFSPLVTTRHDDKWFFVESDGMPDHRMMVGITAWQQQVPLPQTYRGTNAWQFPLYPRPAATPLSAKEHFFRGAIAIAGNGVPIFNPIKNDGRTDTFLAGELDEFGGHGGRADDYHYHTAPLHLVKTLGPGTPIAYALDGYPIYGLTEPDGSAPGKLDAFNGHTGKDGRYHYHATRTYPYLNGGFHGEVADIGGQVDPQPRADPVRPASQPLRGARITGFEKLAGNSYTLTYAVGTAVSKVHYTIEPNGTYVFDYINPDGSTRAQTYTKRDKPTGGDGGRGGNGGGKQRLPRPEDERQ
jgi:hypothetical protein